MAASLEFRASNPRRPVSWRWQRAGLLAENQRQISRHIDDQDVDRARRFRMQLNRARTEDQYLRILAGDPALYEAWSLFHDASENSGVRYELEARLLARSTPEEISHKVAVTPETAAIYESCFFHVTDRLDIPGYIMHSVMGPALQKGLSQRQHDLLWKMYGYAGGPLVLDSLIYAFNSPARPETVDQVNSFWRDDIKDGLTRKAATAIRMLSINWQTGVEIMNLYFRMLEMERNAGEGGGSGSEAVSAAVDAMMKSLPWSKPLMTQSPGTENMIARSPEQHPMIRQLDAQGIGLRSNELMLFASGTIPQGFAHMLETAVFPEGD